MKRRELIGLLGGAAAAWPLAARAQQQAIPVVGYLHIGSSEPYAAMITAFREGLQETGRIEGQNVTIEYRWAEGQLQRLPSLAAELVNRRVAVLATGGGVPPALAAKQATATIPIVFVASDPVKTGLVASLNRPDANLTGVSIFTQSLGPKRLDMVRELVPHAAKIAVLLHPIASGLEEEIERAARSVHQSIHVVTVRTDQEIDAAFEDIVEAKPDALLVISSSLFTNKRHQIVALANHYRLPTIYPLREYVVSGGLMSYGTSISDAYRKSGVYAGRLIDGDKPNDLPILQPTKFDLVVNLRTAKTLGLTIPDKLLALADEVIE